MVVLLNQGLIEPLIPQQIENLPLVNEGRQGKSFFSRVVDVFDNFMRDRAIRKVEANGLGLREVSVKFRDDERVVLAAVKSCGCAIDAASDRLKGNKRIVLEAIAHWGSAFVSGIHFRNPFECASANLKDDPEVVDAAFQMDRSSLQHASRNRVLDKVQQDGLNLQYASLAHRNDFELVLAAVRQNGSALQYASDVLRENREIVLAAGGQYPPAIGLLNIDIPSRFTVKLDDIDNNPVQVLKDLYPKMENGFPAIRYEGSPGVDVGGLTRDFVSRMMKAVCDLEKKPLPMKEIGGKLIPLLEDGKPDQIKAYQTIGAIFASALEKHKDIVTGNYFNPMFFQMIHSLTNGELAALPDLSKYEDIPQEIADKLFRIYASYDELFSDEQIEGILQGNISQELQDLTGCNRKEDFFSSDFKQMALGCATISKSMRAHLSNPNTWDPIKGSAVELAAKIEGSLTKDGVKASLQWNRDHQATKGHLTNWLDECSHEDLEKFVWAITGSKTLAPGQKLKINLYPELNKLPAYHTCFFSMDLPDGYPSYEVFKHKLEQSLSSVEGMQMA